MKTGRIVKGIGGYYFLSKWDESPSGGIQPVGEASRWDVSRDVLVIELAAIRATLNSLLESAPNPQTAEWLRGVTVGPKGDQVGWNTSNKEIENGRLPTQGVGSDE